MAPWIDFFKNHFLDLSMVSEAKIPLFSEQLSKMGHTLPKISFFCLFLRGHYIFWQRSEIKSSESWSTCPCCRLRIPNPPAPGPHHSISNHYENYLIKNEVEYWLRQSIHILEKSHISRFFSSRFQKTESSIPKKSLFVKFPQIITSNSHPLIPHQ